jgi:glycosyltransferase involved in cell wall biosynthesis
MKRVAVILHGGIAPPSSRQFVPALTGLIERLAERFTMTVYTCMTSENAVGEFLCGKARVVYLPVRFGASPTHIILHAVRAFRAAHRQQPYDLVHGFWATPGGLAATLAGRLTGVPHMVSLLGGESASLPRISYGNMRTRAPRLATLWTVSHASAVTTLTRYQLRELRRFGFNRQDDVRVIPFGADPRLFMPSHPKLLPPPFNLLHVGHLNDVKDQATLLKAFRRITEVVDCQLRIVGEGPREGTLRELAQTLGVRDRVTFEGYVPHTRIPAYFHWAHLLLHSSLYEGQGVVFAEAASSGVPVCGTRVGLLDDLHASTGASVPPELPDALAESAIALLSHPSRMCEVQAVGLRWAAEHSLDWTASTFSDLYSTLMHRN